MDLDRPIRAALSTRLLAFSEGTARARRMTPEVGPFGALASPTAEAWSDLAALHPGAPVVLFTPDPIAVPGGWIRMGEFPLPQMVYDGPAPAAPDLDFVELGPADNPAMRELTKLTEPGPFGTRTHELGDYIGLRRDGRLLAMAGERLQFPGHTEISAVCTHPDALGRGYASALVRELARRIVARGERPFLHVRPENARAIAVYERLGFRERRRLHVCVLRRAADQPATAESAIAGS